MSMWISTDLRPLPFQVAIKSAQQSRKVQDTLLEVRRDDVEAIVEIDNGDTKFSVTAASVRAMLWDQCELAQGDLRRLTIVFEDACGYLLPVSGVKRAQDAYRTLSVLLNKKPTRFLIRTLQDEGRPALLRHYGVIKEISLERVL